MRGTRNRLVALPALLLVACTSTLQRGAPAGSGAGAGSLMTGGTGASNAGTGSGGASAEPAPPDASLEIDGTIATQDAGRDAEPVPAEDDAAVDAAIDAGEPVAIYRTNRSGADMFELRIDKIVTERGYCVQLAIAWPYTPHEPDELEVPAPWNLMYAWAIEGIETNEDCKEGLAGDGVHNLQEALSARGRIAMRGPDDSVPCNIDVDIELTFVGTNSIPTNDRLLATDLPVECDFF